MELDRPIEFNAELIEELRLMALQDSTPTEILHHLKGRVSEREEFVSYMLEAFPGDDGDVWAVASRWWNNNISEQAANLFLKEVFEKLLAGWRTEGYMS